MIKSNFARKIVGWYHDHRRQLPWRETSDPYRIWLSEIILQQTRVAQGLPYYEKFVRTFPTVQSLAAAKEQEVLRLWQGLGYYTRARNLHRCAKFVAEQSKGKFPHRYEELLKLPGIGSYTAAAIASFAFGEAVAVLDGNVFRILSRVFGLEVDIQSPEGKRQFSKLANELIPQEFPAAFNQAIMEFGALHCLPRNPDCDQCIFNKQCVARARGLQEILPVKSKKAKVKKRFFHYFILEYRGKWHLQERHRRDIWKGLYDFYLVETKTPQNSEKVFNEDVRLKAMKIKGALHKVPASFKHILTHQHLVARFVEVNLVPCRANDRILKSSQMKFFSRTQIENLPKPVLISRYLAESRFL